MKAHPVVGIDECGMGELAGPLVVCGFTCPDEFLPVLRSLRIRDSKTTTPHERIAMRTALFDAAKRHECWYVLVPVTPYGLDDSGIWQSWRNSLDRLIRNHVARHPGMLPEFRIDGQPTGPYDTAWFLQQGDESDLRIQAASILAKQFLDRYWADLDREYPEWKFCEHAGNASPHHIRMLQQFGPIPGVHRTRPVQTLFKTLSKGGGPPLATQP